MEAPIVTLSNLPPPDELAQVRDKIRRLTERETELRNLLIENPDVREGASYLAEIKVVKAPRTDLKELRHFHPTIVDEFTYMLEQTRVVLMGVTEDGEIVSPRKLKAD